jgi:hypothetical protein
VSGSGPTARRIAAPLTVAALALSSCSLIPGSQRLGVSAGPGGGVRVHFVPCPGQTVTKVAYLGNVGSGFSSETGNDEPADDPDDDEVVLWLVTSAGSTESTFDIGDRLPGFTQQVPLQGAPSEVDAPAVFVGYQGDGLGSLEIGFPYDDLEPNRILTLEDYKDPAEFRADAEATCG